MAVSRRLFRPDAAPRPADPGPAPAPAVPFSPPPPLEHIVQALGLAGPSREAVARVLAHRLGDPRTLGLLRAADVAAISGLLREAFVGANPQALRLGRILLAQRRVEPRPLARALATQRESGRRIGEELVQTGMLDPRAIARALWLQHKLTATVRFLRQEPGMLTYVGKNSP